MEDAPRSPERTIPLLPLPDFVHFPRTSARLHVTEPRHRRLVRELLEREESARLLGMVLLKPGLGQNDPAGGEIFPGGTAARVVDVESFADGRSNVILEGMFRFVIRYEVSHDPYREALVQPVEEPRWSDEDTHIQNVRGEILATAGRLAEELAESFPLKDRDLKALRACTSFEEFVNAIAAEIDVPVLRKLELLVAALPERALDLLGILKARQRVLDTLRPFRRLSGKAEQN